jgi:hypothetical protein
MVAFLNNEDINDYKFHSIITGIIMNGNTSIAVATIVNSPTDINIFKGLNETEENVLSEAVNYLKSRYPSYKVVTNKID